MILLCQYLIYRVSPAATFLDRFLFPGFFQAAWTQIKDMVVRGAPAIGVTGVLSLATDLVTNKNAGGSFATVDEAQTYIFETLDYLVTRCHRM